MIPKKKEFLVTAPWVMQPCRGNGGDVCWRRRGVRGRPAGGRERTGSGGRRARCTRGGGAGELERGWVAGLNCKSDITRDCGFISG
jgi:hypothetical protein